MNEYLVSSENRRMIFFNKAYEGICVRIEKPGGWEEGKSICPEGSETFFAYSDSNDIIHLITVSKSNQLIYMVCKNGQWRKFMICNINENIRVRKIMIGTSDIGENLFYSAQYGGEYILVHCVLGNRAMPSTIDKMADENFFVCNKKVYYSNSDGVIGYRDFSDSKPDRFLSLQPGIMPYFHSVSTKEYLVYKRDSYIYINEKAYAKDNSAEFPIILSNNNEIILMWKSRDFVRYIALDDEDTQQRSVKRIATGLKPTTYICSDGETTRIFFGSLSGGVLRLYACDDEQGASEKRIDTELRQEAESLKKMVAEQEKDIKMYKNEIERLNDIIEKMISNIEKDKKV